MQDTKLVIYETASGRKFFYKKLNQKKEVIEMASKPIKDAVVILGKYVDSTGKERVRSQNVGILMQKDDGGTFLMLNRTFNPAGVPVDGEYNSNVIISFYDPKPRENAPQSTQRAQPAPTNTNALDDDNQF